MRTFIRGLKLAALVGAIGVALPGTAMATDLINFKTVYNTDFASAGVGGMRGNGTGTITLAPGINPGTVTEAYLFWHGPSNAAPADAPTANATVTFNGTNVTGAFLGISSDNCWGFQNSLAYRADVTSLVTGSGSYALTNFTKPGNIDVNGASLIVFYNDGISTNNRDVVMFNGNDSNIPNPYDANGWNITLAGINYSSGTASAQFHVSDGQTFTDAPVIANGTDITAGLNGNIFQGDSTPPVPPVGNGNLWDIKNFSVTSLLSPGLNNLNITSGVAGDCLSCVMIAIDLPAGAAPQPNPAPEPATLGLVGAALAGLAVVRRRRKV
jgi:hypothetical protein